MYNEKRKFKSYDYHFVTAITLEIEITVGTYKEVDIAHFHFDRIDDVTYEGLPENAQIALSEIVLSPQRIMIVSSAALDSDWLGRQVKCKALIHGIRYYDRERRILITPPFWHFLLMETGRLINDGENNLAIITSDTAFESFLSDFIAIKLRNSGAWSGLQDDLQIQRFRDKFLAGPDSMRLNERIALFVKAWLGIQYAKEIFEDWQSKVHSKRNALVHSVTRRRYDPKAALQAFRASCRFIHEILSLDPGETSLKDKYMGDLTNWIEDAEDSLKQLEEPASSTP
jgi:hypothetical protein